MPVYEFKCEEGHITEHILPWSEADTSRRCDCEQCGKPAERIISSSNFSLKGNWYKTTGRY